MTGKPAYKPTTWRDVTPEVVAYVNQNAGVINIGSANSWIRKLNLKKSWGIKVPPLSPIFVTWQTPSAKIRFTFTTSKNDTPQSRQFSASQKLIIP